MNISYLRWLKELSHFKAFYNDWIDCSGMINETGESHKLNLDPNFFHSLKFDESSLRQYRIDAAKLCAETLGDKPALCLSGGIDSQAMVQCWKEAELDFDVIILTFKNELNVQDSNHAKLFCDQNNIKYVEIELDIVSFLIRENMEIGDKYKSNSPHFNTHYKLAEILFKRGYTGVCCGGSTPYNHLDHYGYNFAQNPFHFLKIQDKFEGVFQGSFLSFYPELTWATAFLTDPFVEEVIVNNKHDGMRTWEHEQRMNHIRYLQKIDGYRRTGFNIIPQETKFTGFELVKKYFEEQTGDGWTFERKFRYPLTMKHNKDVHTYKMYLTPDQKTVIDSIYRNILRAG